MMYYGIRFEDPWTLVKVRVRVHTHSVLGVLCTPCSMF